MIEPESLCFVQIKFQSCWACIICIYMYMRSYQILNVENMLFMVILNILNATEI